MNEERARPNPPHELPPESDGELGADELLMTGLPGNAAGDAAVPPERETVPDDPVSRMRRDLMVQSSRDAERRALNSRVGAQTRSEQPPHATDLRDGPRGRTGLSVSPLVLIGVALVVMGLAVLGIFVLRTLAANPVASALPTPGVERAGAGVLQTPVTQPATPSVPFVAATAARTPPSAMPPSAMNEALTPGVPTAIETPALDPAVLYAADGTHGVQGWPAEYGWSSSDELLRNDGSDFGDGNWRNGLWNLHWVAAPFALPADLTRYAVEAEIQVNRRPACGSFGLVVRGSVQIGMHDCQVGVPPTLSIRSSAPALLANAAVGEHFDPSQGWHVYRVEVRGDEIQVLVDGVVIAAVRDATSAGSGSVGLWDDHTEIAVRAFRVRRL